MDSQPNQPHTLCRKCNNYVRTNNYLIHQARCKGPVLYGEQRSPSRIFNSSRLSNRSNSRRQPTQVEQQRIPCHFCGYGQTFAQLDTHPNRCEHRQEQCSRCHNKFPRSLMDQHKFVCPANRQPAYQQHESEQSQPQFLPNIMRNRISEQEQFRRNGPQSMLEFMMQSFGSPNIRRMNSNPHPRGQRGQRVIVIHDFGQLIRLLAGGGLQEQHGMKKQEITKFPTSKFNPKQKIEGDQDMCIICYCNFQQNQNYMTLPCKHVFHPDCISTWLQKNSTCPVCKKNFGQKQQQQQDQSQSDYSRHRPMPMFRFFRNS